MSKILFYILKLISGMFTDITLLNGYLRLYLWKKVNALYGKSIQYYNTKFSKLYKV